MKTFTFQSLLIFFIFTLCLFSCKEETDLVENNEVKTTCDLDNPLENIPWLTEIRDGFDMQANPLPKKITQYFYQGECVFLVDGCVGCQDNLTVVYNVDEEVICEFGGVAGVNTCPNFQDEATDETVLYGN